MLRPCFGLLRLPARQKYRSFSTRQSGYFTHHSTPYSRTDSDDDDDIEMENFPGTASKVAVLYPGSVPHPPKPSSGWFLAPGSELLRREMRHPCWSCVIAVATLTHKGFPGLNKAGLSFVSSRLSVLFCAVLVASGMPVLFWLNFCLVAGLLASVTPPRDDS